MSPVIMDQRPKEIAIENQKLYESIANFEEACKNTQNGSNQHEIDSATNYLTLFQNEQIFYDTVIQIIYSSHNDISVFIAADLICKKVNESFDDIPISKIETLFRIPCTRLKYQTIQLEDRERLKLIECSSSIAIKDPNFISHYHELAPQDQLVFFTNIFDYIYSDKCNNFTEIQKMLIRYSDKIHLALDKSDMCIYWILLLRYYVRITSNIITNEKASNLLQKLKANFDMSLEKQLIVLFEEFCSLPASKFHPGQKVFISETILSILEYLDFRANSEADEESMNIRSYIWNLVLDISPEFYIMLYNHDLCRRGISQFIGEVSKFDVQSDQFKELLEASSQLVGVLSSQENTPFPNEIINYLRTFVYVPADVDIRSKSLEKLFKNMSTYMGKVVVDWYNNEIKENGLTPPLYYAISNSSKHLRQYFVMKATETILSQDDKATFLQFIAKFAQFINFIGNPQITYTVIQYFNFDNQMVAKAIYRMAKFNSKSICFSHSQNVFDSILNLLGAPNEPHVSMHIVTALVYLIPYVQFTPELAQKFLETVYQTSVYATNYSSTHGSNSQDNFHFIADYYCFIQQKIDFLSLPEQVFECFTRCFWNTIEFLMQFSNYQCEYMHETITAVFLAGVKAKWCHDLSVPASYLSNGIQKVPLPIHFVLAEEILDVQPNPDLLGAICEIETSDDPLLAIAGIRFNQRLINYNYKIFLDHFSVDFIGRLLDSNNPGVVNAALSTISVLVQRMTVEELNDYFPKLFEFIYPPMIEKWDPSNVRLFHRIIKRIAKKHDDPDPILLLFQAKLPIQSSYYDDFAETFVNENVNIYDSYDKLMQVVLLYRKPRDEMLVELGIAPE